MSELDDRLNEVAEGLWVRCSEVAGATRSEKDTNPLHTRIAGFLDVANNVKTVAKLVGIDIPLNAPSGKAYREDFATTVLRDVSIPKAWMRQGAQLILLYGHECQHVVQHTHGVAMRHWPSWLEHSVLYLAGVVFHSQDGEEYTGKVEADAYAVTETAYRFLTGKVRTLAEVEGPLVRSYNLFDFGTFTARGILKSHITTLRMGGVPNVTMANITQQYLEEKAADLRGRVIL